MSDLHSSSGENVITNGGAQIINRLDNNSIECQAKTTDTNNNQIDSKDQKIILQQNGDNLKSQNVLKNNSLDIGNTQAEMVGASQKQANMSQYISQMSELPDTVPLIMNQIGTKKLTTKVSTGDDSQHKELLLNTLSDFSPISRIEDSRADVTSQIFDISIIQNNQMLFHQSSLNNKLDVPQQEGKPFIYLEKCVDSTNQQQQQQQPSKIVVTQHGQYAQLQDFKNIKLKERFEKFSTQMMSNIGHQKSQRQEPSERKYQAKQIQSQNFKTFCQFVKQEDNLIQDQVVLKAKQKEEENEIVNKRASQYEETEQQSKRKQAVSTYAKLTESWQRKTESFKEEKGKSSLRIIESTKINKISQHETTKINKNNKYQFAVSIKHPQLEQQQQQQHKYLFESPQQNLIYSEKRMLHKSHSSSPSSFTNKCMNEFLSTKAANHQKDIKGQFFTSKLHEQFDQGQQLKNQSHTYQEQGNVQRNDNTTDNNYIKEQISQEQDQNEEKVEINLYKNRKISQNYQQEQDLKPLLEQNTNQNGILFSQTFTQEIHNKHIPIDQGDIAISSKRSLSQDNIKLKESIKSLQQETRLHTEITKSTIKEDSNKINQFDNNIHKLSVSNLSCHAQYYSQAALNSKEVDFTDVPVDKSKQMKASISSVVQLSNKSNGSTSIKGRTKEDFFVSNKRYEEHQKSTQNNSVKRIDSNVNLNKKTNNNSNMIYLFNITGKDKTLNNHNSNLISKQQQPQSKLHETISHKSKQLSLDLRTDKEISNLQEEKGYQSSHKLQENNQKLTPNNLRQDNYNCNKGQAEPNLIEQQKNKRTFQQPIQIDSLVYPIQYSQSLKSVPILQQDSPIKPIQNKILCQTPSSQQYSQQFLNKKSGKEQMLKTQSSFKSVSSKKQFTNTLEQDIIDLVEKKKEIKQHIEGSSEREKQLSSQLMSLRYFNDKVKNHHMFQKELLENIDRNNQTKRYSQGLSNSFKQIEGTTLTQQEKVGKNIMYFSQYNSSTDREDNMKQKNKIEQINSVYESSKDGSKNQSNKGSIFMSDSLVLQQSQENSFQTKYFDKKKQTPKSILSSPASNLEDKSQISSQKDLKDIKQDQKKQLQPQQVSYSILNKNNGDTLTTPKNLSKYGKFKKQGSLPDNISKDLTRSEVFQDSQESQVSLKTVGVDNSPSRGFSKQKTNTQSNFFAHQTNNMIGEKIIKNNDTNGNIKVSDILNTNYSNLNKNNVSPMSTKNCQQNQDIKVQQMQKKLNILFRNSSPKQQQQSIKSINCVLSEQERKELRNKIQQAEQEGGKGIRLKTLNSIGCKQV